MSPERPAASGTVGPLTGGIPRSQETGGERSTAVVLVGHGSHQSSGSARPVHALARRLRQSGAFSEVCVAFWKEEPSLRHAFDLVENHEVFVVPIFTSEGYFTDRVVPREMGINGPLTKSRGRRIHYLPPVGTHPRISEVVLERAREAAPLSEQAIADATLVVVGHGTDRHPRSAATTLALVERLRDTSSYGEVHAAFLDQDPEVSGLLSRMTASNVIVVPFFISEGWHTGTTIPRDLALEGGRTQRGDTAIWYALPVGTHERMPDVVRDLVAEASGASEADLAEGHPELPARRARRAFQDWINATGAAPRRFLEIEISRRSEGAFQVRHVADRDRPDLELHALHDPEDAEGVAAVTADGRHRPLRSAPSLQAGWRFDGLSAEQVWEVVTHLYSTAAVHHDLGSRRALPTTSFSETARRQSGMYEGVGALPDAAVTELASVCCASDHCLREPVWPPAGGSPSGGGVPCPEPCSLFISMAKEELDERRRG